MIQKNTESTLNSSQVAPPPPWYYPSRVPLQSGCQMRSGVFDRAQPSAASPGHPNFEWKSCHALLCGTCRLCEPLQGQPEVKQEYEGNVAGTREGMRVHAKCMLHKMYTPCVGKRLATSGLDSTPRIYETTYPELAKTIFA